MSVLLSPLLLLLSLSSPTPSLHWQSGQSDIPRSRSAVARFPSPLLTTRHFLIPANPLVLGCPWTLLLDAGDARDTREAWDAPDAGMLEMPGVLWMAGCSGCSDALDVLDQGIIWTPGCSGCFRCWDALDPRILWMLGMLWIPGRFRCWGCSGPPRLSSHPSSQAWLPAELCSLGQRGSTEQLGA